MGKAPDLNDYIDVRERMAEFFEAYPEGSFQSECQFLQTDGRDAVVVKAYAYRFPEDPRPGHGLAFEFIPGRTPYTKDSELQNAETAAWGRAVVAVGAGDTKRTPIASREEVRNRTAPENVVDNLAGRQALRNLCDERRLDRNLVANHMKQHLNMDAGTASNDELFAFVNAVASGLVVLPDGTE